MDGSADWFAGAELQAPVFLTLDHNELHGYRAFSSANFPVDYADLETLGDLQPASLRLPNLQDRDVYAAKDAKIVDNGGPQIQPSYVEPWSSISTPNANVLEDIAKVLERNATNVCLTNFKIKARFPSLNGTVGKIDVFLYRQEDSETSHYTVEAVRRSGDILVFNSIWRVIQDVVTSAAHTNAVAALIAPSADELPSISSGTLAELLSTA